MPRPPPRARHAAAWLATAQDKRSQRLIHEITSLLLSADLDAAMDAAAAEISPGLVRGLSGEAEIEAEAVRLAVPRR